jgi:HK97 family phage major capsid protein
MAKSKHLYRFVEVDPLERKASAKNANRFQVAFASEFPVERSARSAEVRMGAVRSVGETYLEVLSHDRADADFSDLNNNGPFLDEHDRQIQIGKIRKAVLSKDKRSRASIEYDGVTDLSKTRAEQMRAGSRPHLSVGYEHTKFVGERKLDDGRVAKVFAWRANEISSVSMPADPTAGEGRSREGAVRSEDETARCIGCGEAQSRSDLDDDFMCEDCLESNRAKAAQEELERKAAEDLAAHDAQVEADKKRTIDSRPVNMPEETILITESDKKVRAAQTAAEEAGKTATATAVKGIFERNKVIGENVDNFIKDHGMKGKGECSRVLARVATKYCNKDSTAPTETLLRELGQECLSEIAKFPNMVYTREAAGISDEEISKYSLIRAIRYCVENQAALPGGFELEMHQDMERAFKDAGGKPKEAQGFHVPSFVRMKAGNRHARANRFRRDNTVGDFGSGGALVPTELHLPVIELLVNRTVLDWAGETYLGGLMGNVIIPRQTAAVLPQAVAEIGLLGASQQVFDQIELRPRRVGNTQNYSKQLIIQSSPDIEALIRDDNFRQLAIFVDEMGLNGSGAGSQPLGVMNTPGIGAITFGGSATYANVVLMETLIRKKNVYDPVKYLSTSNTRGKLKTAPATLTGSTVVSGYTNSIWTGEPQFGAESVAGRPARDSQQIPNDQMLCGAFEHFLHGQWGGLDVVVDYFTLAKTGEVAITFNTYHDFAARHPEAFSISTDSAAQ